MATLAVEHEDVLAQMQRLISARRQWSASSVCINSQLSLLGADQKVYQPKGDPSIRLLYHGVIPREELALLELATPCTYCSGEGRSVYHDPGKCE